MCYGSDHIDGVCTFVTSHVVTYVTWLVAQRGIRAGLVSRPGFGCAVPKRAALQNLPQQIPTTQTALFGTLVSSE